MVIVALGVVNLFASWAEEEDVEALTERVEELEQQVALLTSARSTPPLAYGVSAAVDSVSTETNA